MKPPRSVGELDADLRCRSVMLKTKGPFKALDVKVGDLRAELWEYCKSVAEPYARLIVECDPDRQDDGEEGEGPTLQVTLDPMHASVFAFAITNWVEFLSSNLKGKATPALTAEIESLQLRLYESSPDNGGLWTELTVRGAGDFQRTVTLTYLEARLLADVLGSMMPDDEKGAE